MNIKNVSIRKTSQVCLLSLVLTDASYAQDRQLPSEDAQLEQITVTAQQEVQNIQYEPVSVIALPESFLNNNNIRTIEDLNGTVPRLYATNSTNYEAAPLSFRGIGGATSGGNSFYDEYAAFYTDEAFFLETNQKTSTFSGTDMTELSVRQSVMPIDETWIIGLFGQNITDQRTITQVAALGGYHNAALNEPSKWGRDFVYHF